MPDSVETLSQATGLSRDDLVSIWEQVKANGKLLAACSRHDFQPVDAKVVLGSKYRCTRCLGTVDAVAVSWYLQGLQHGAGQP